MKIWQPCTVHCSLPGGKKRGGGEAFQLHHRETETSAGCFFLLLLLLLRGFGLGGSLLPLSPSSSCFKVLFVFVFCFPYLPPSPPSSPSPIGPLGAVSPISFLLKKVFSVSLFLDMSFDSWNAVSGPFFLTPLIRCGGETNRFGDHGELHARFYAIFAQNVTEEKLAYTFGTSTCPSYSCRVIPNIRQIYSGLSAFFIGTSCMCVRFFLLRV